MGRAPLPPQGQPARDGSPTNGASGREHAEQAPRQARLSSGGARRLPEGSRKMPSPPPLSSGAAAAGSASAGLLAALPDPPPWAGGQGRAPTRQLAALLDAFVCKFSRRGYKIIVPLIPKSILLFFFFFFFFFTNSLCLFVSPVASAHQSPTFLFSARFISKDVIMAAVQNSHGGIFFFCFVCFFGN